MRVELNNTYPSIQVSKAKIKALYQVEKAIGNRRKKLTTFEDLGMEEIFALR